MANFMRKFKFGLKSRLGLMPGTMRIEARDMKLKKEYEEFLNYEKSGEPQRFQELENIVTSQDFKDRKKYIKNQRFKGSDAYNKLQEYKSMKKSPAFKGYLRFVSSKYFPDFEKFDDSEEIKKIEAAGKDNQEEIKALKKSPGIQAYYKLKNSKDLEYFRILHNSPEMQRFKELENYINSDEFKETEEYLKSPGKFKKSAEYKQLTEYKELKKSWKLKWYNKLRKSDKFDELKKWKLVFSDDFTGNELDKSKWLTSFFWGKKLLGESYSLAKDQHYYTEGNNHEVTDNQLKLYTRKENITGQAWDPEIGFFPKEFEYTSGMVNTGESHSQKYGAFEAKVRMHDSPLIYHVFSILAEKMIPHIDIFRFSGKNKKRIEFNSYWDEREDTKIRKRSDDIGGIDFSRGFFIFRLEWYPDRLVWKINDTVVKTSDKGLPREPMYILLGSGVDNGGSETGLPTRLDIDWVRCYELVEEQKKS